MCETEWSKFSCSKFGSKAKEVDDKCEKEPRNQVLKNIEPDENADNSNNENNNKICWTLPMSQALL